MTELVTAANAETSPVGPGSGARSSRLTKALGSGSAGLVVSAIGTIAGFLLAGAMITRLVATLVVPARMLLLVVGLALAALCFRHLVRLIGGSGADPILWFAAGFLILLTLGAVCVNFFPFPEGMDPSLTLSEASRATPDLLSTHPLGTDTAGLDLLSQSLIGARVTLIVAGGATILALFVGGALGLLAGYARGRVDAAIVFLADSLLAFPPLILLMAMVTILRPTTLNLTLALAVIVTPNFIRLSRANTIKMASREFVTASRALGARPSRIALRVVLPNVVPSLVAYGCVLIGILAVAEGSLSFLGLGIQRPLPTWGNMIAQGQPHLETSPHMVLVPALALFGAVLAINYVGQKLQQRWGA